jgi:hypothetical protein
MDAVFKKLNYKDQKEIVVANSPDSFEENLESIRPVATVLTSLANTTEITFAMLFVKTQKEIDELIPQIGNKLKGDAILWMCYPKGTSKKYKCDFNRDTGWAIMGQFDLEPVRMVAIDEDWSALRFKKVDYIKTMKRNSLHALSEKGKEKSGQNTKN